MKVYEILSLNRHLLQVIADASIDASDVKHLEMYREYCRLMSEGHKKAYIMQYLSDEYGISERTIYRIVDRLNIELKLD